MVLVSGLFSNTSIDDAVQANSNEINNLLNQLHKTKYRLFYVVKIKCFIYI